MWQSVSGWGSLHSRNDRVQRRVGA